MPLIWVIQDVFHVFLNNFEMDIFLLLFKLFIIFILHNVSVIFKNREPLIKLFFTTFVCFKLRCKMGGVILKNAKKRLKEEASRICSDSFLRTNRNVSPNFRHLTKMSEDFLKLQRLLSEYLSF